MLLQQQEAVRVEAEGLQLLAALEAHRQTDSLVVLQVQVLRQTVLQVRPEKLVRRTSSSAVPPNTAVAAEVAHTTAEHMS
jgi:ABC-type Na+ efflux pump permease subunit